MFRCLEFAFRFVLLRRSEKISVSFIISLRFFLLELAGDREKVCRHRAKLGAHTRELLSAAIVHIRLSSSGG